MKNSMFSEIYHPIQKIQTENGTYQVYESYCNIHSRYLIDYKIPKVDVLDESAPEYVSILIQINDVESLDYQIRNVYYRGRNYKADKFVSKYRKMLDNIVPLIKR